MDTDQFRHHLNHIDFLSPFWGITCISLYNLERSEKKLSSWSKLAELGSMILNRTNSNLWPELSELNFMTGSGGTRVHVRKWPNSSLKLKAPIHFPAQSCDPISCYGKPVERTNEIDLETFHWSTPLVSRRKWSDRTTESESGSRPEHKPGQLTTNWLNSRQNWPNSPDKKIELKTSWPNSSLQKLTEFITQADRIHHTNSPNSPHKLWEFTTQNQPSEAEGRWEINVKHTPRVWVRAL